MRDSVFGFWDGINPSLGIATGVGTEVALIGYDIGSKLYNLGIISIRDFKNNLIVLNQCYLFAISPDSSKRDMLHHVKYEITPK